MPPENFTMTWGITWVWDNGLAGILSDYGIFLDLDHEP